MFATPLPPTHICLPVNDGILGGKLPLFSRCVVSRLGTARDLPAIFSCFLVYLISSRSPFLFFFFMLFSASVFFFLTLGLILPSFLLPFFVEFFSSGPPTTHAGALLCGTVWCGIVRCRIFFVAAGATTAVRV